MGKLALLALILIFIPSTQAITFDDITDVINSFITPENYAVTSHQYPNVKSWNYETNEGNVIYRVIHSVDPGTQVNETYYYGNQEIDVDFSYQHSWITSTYYFQISNGTYTEYFNYSHYSWGTTKNFIVAYTMDDQAFTGLSVYVDVSVLKPGITIDADDLEKTPVTRVVGISNQHLDLNVETVSYAGFQESREETEEIATGRSYTQWLTEFMTIWGAISGLFYSIYWILKTIFVDNLFLTIMFFESFALIYSMQARNIYQWWDRMVKAHKGFIEFIIKLMSFVVDILYKVVMTVLKIIKPTG